MSPEYAVCKGRRYIYLSIYLSIYMSWSELAVRPVIFVAVNPLFMLRECFGTYITATPQLLPVCCSFQSDCNTGMALFVQRVMVFDIPICRNAFLKFHELVQSVVNNAGLKCCYQENLLLNVFNPEASYSHIAIHIYRV